MTDQLHLLCHVCCNTSVTNNINLLKRGQRLKSILAETRFQRICDNLDEQHGHKMVHTVLSGALGSPV